MNTLTKVMLCTNIKALKATIVGTELGSSTYTEWRTNFFLKSTGKL